MAQAIVENKLNQENTNDVLRRVKKQRNHLRTIENTRRKFVWTFVT